jgi:hypothetical protein
LDERIAKCCGVSVTTVSNRRTKNIEKSEECCLSGIGKKRTRKSERNTRIFADEFDFVCGQKGYRLLFPKFAYFKAWESAFIEKGENTFSWVGADFRKRNKYCTQLDIPCI